MFKIMKSGFDCTNLEQIICRKLLNLLFKHMSHKWPKNDQNYSNKFSYDFLWLSDDILQHLLDDFDVWNNEIEIWLYQSEADEL